MLGRLYAEWREWLLREWRQPRPRNAAWLVVLPAAVCLLDLAATLRGQPAAYWRGDYGQLIEGNPFGWVALRLHPGVFLAGVLLWVACFAAFIVAAPRRWSLSACLALIAGHTIGTCSWLPRLFPYWFLVGTGFCLVVLILALPTWRAWRQAWPAPGPAPSPLPQQQVD